MNYTNVAATPGGSQKANGQANPESLKTDRLAAVVCGSFRRGLPILRSDLALLVGANCEVLSPLDVDFVREEDGFVFADRDEGLSPSEIENAHLAALRAADLVWLHTPDGYVGPSGAFELGIAAAAGVPVFCRNAPRDVSLRDFVRLVSSPTAAAAAVRGQRLVDPGAGVRALQVYYGRMAEARGWSDETPVESIVLLMEEVGELARAVRKDAGLADRREDDNVSEELADVQLYVVHLANVLGVDLASAVTLKEEVNSRRFAGLEARTA